MTWRGVILFIADLLLHQRLQGCLCSGTWRDLFPSFCADHGVSRVVPLSYSHPFLSHQLGTIYPFFNLLSQRHQQLHSQAQFGQQRVLDFFGAGWGWLCLTPGQLLVSSHRSPEPSCYQTLPHEPVTHIITQKQRQNLFQVIKSNIMITAHTDSWLYTQVKKSMTMAQ